MSQLKICPQCGSEYELDQRFCPKDGTTLRAQNAGGDLVGEISGMLTAGNRLGSRAAGGSKVEHPTDL